MLKIFGNMKKIIFNNINTNWTSAVKTSIIKISTRTLRNKLNKATALPQKHCKTRLASISLTNQNKMS